MFPLDFTQPGIQFIIVAFALGAVLILIFVMIISSIGQLDINSSSHDNAQSGGGGFGGGGRSHGGGVSHSGNSGASFHANSFHSHGNHSSSKTSSPHLSEEKQEKHNEIMEKSKKMSKDLHSLNSKAKESFKNKNIAELEEISKEMEQKQNVFSQTQKELEALMNF